MSTEVWLISDHADLKAEKLAYNDIFVLEQFGLYADLRNSPNPDADVEHLKLRRSLPTSARFRRSDPSVSVRARG